MRTATSPPAGFREEFSGPPALLSRLQTGSAVSILEPVSSHDE
jgi:hypothetical protein